LRSANEQEHERNRETEKPVLFPEVPFGHRLSGLFLLLFDEVCALESVPHFTAKPFRESVARREHWLLDREPAKRFSKSPALSGLPSHAAFGSSQVIE
jgi:hypothetical protein